MKDDPVHIYEHEHHFNDHKSAVSFFLEKRLQLQRLYQLTSEPYFGMPEEQECDSSINTQAPIQEYNGSKSYVLKLLANKELALGDCLYKNNDYRAIYQYTLCESRVIEERFYFDFGQKAEVKIRDCSP